MTSSDPKAISWILDHGNACFGGLFVLTLAGALLLPKPDPAESQDRESPATQITLADQAILAQLASAPNSSSPSTAQPTAIKASNPSPPPRAAPPSAPPPPQASPPADAPSLPSDLLLKIPCPSWTETLDIQQDDEGPPPGHPCPPHPQDPQPRPTQAPALNVPEPLPQTENTPQQAPSPAPAAPPQATTSEIPAPLAHAEDVPPQAPALPPPPDARERPEQPGGPQGTTEPGDPLQVPQGYYERLRDRIAQQAARKYPSRALVRGEEGTVTLRLVVSEAGELLETNVIQERTDASRTLRDAAERSARASAPFEALPAGTGERVIVVPLTYKLQ